MYENWLKNMISLNAHIAQMLNKRSRDYHGQVAFMTRQSSLWKVNKRLKYQPGALLSDYMSGLIMFIPLTKLPKYPILVINNIKCHRRYTCVWKAFKFTCNCRKYVGIFRNYVFIDLEKSLYIFYHTASHKNILDN